MAGPAKQIEQAQSQGTEVQPNQKPKNVLGSIQTLLNQYKHQIEMAIPKHLTADRLIRIALTAVAQSPKLQECSPLSICGAVIQAGTLGLEPTSVLGECFLVPFWNKRSHQMEAQLIVGYQGKIKLVSNTGDLLGVKACPVRKNDVFTFDDGLDPFVSHKYHHIPDRGPVVGYWAGCMLKNGFKSISYMTVKEMEEHRDKFAMTRGKEGIFGFWVENFEGAALKTVIHKALKYIPKSVQAATAWSLDERAEAGMPQKFSVEVPLELQPVGADDYEEPSPAKEPIKEPQEKPKPEVKTEAKKEPEKPAEKKEEPKADSAAVRKQFLREFDTLEEHMTRDEFYRILKMGKYESVSEMPTSEMAAEIERIKNRSA